MDENKIIGKFLKQLREERGLTQEKLAELISIDRTVVNKWETGKNPIPIDHVKTLTDIFGVTADEILMGERMTPKNKDKFENFHWELFYKNARFYKKVRILVYSIVGIILLFFAYYFVTTYNKIQVYKINSESDIFTINNGLFIKARDKVYFELNNTYLIDESEIDKVKVCYKIDNNKTCILETTDLDKISFVDYAGYEEYISFKSIDKIMKNLTIELILNNGDVKSSKLLFEKDYANGNIFPDKRVKNRPTNSTNEASDNEIEKLSEELIKSRKIDTPFNYTFENVDYTVSHDDVFINIEYSEAKNRFTISNNVSQKLFQADLYSNDEYVRSQCTYSYSKDKCLIDDCSNCDKFIDTYKNVIKDILESN